MRALMFAALILCAPAHAPAQEPDGSVPPTSALTALAPLPAGAPAARFPQVMSERGIRFLMSAEGFRSNAYPDLGGGYSIGYGFRTWRGRRVTLVYPRRVTEAEAVAELQRQLFTYEHIVRREFARSIPQHSFDALVSLCYNLGRLNTSILHKVRTGRPVGIQDFLTTASVRSRFSRALYSRRVREFAMFIGRYDDALSSRLDAWKAARVVHQELIGHAVWIVGSGAPPAVAGMLSSVPGGSAGPSPQFGDRDSPSKAGEEGAAVPASRPVAEGKHDDGEREKEDSDRQPDVSH